VATLTYYAVELIPVEGTALTPELIAKHAGHLRELDGDGKLILAGPFTDDPRGLLVLNCADAGAAKAILAVDPLVVAGVRTFRVNSWLMANAGNGYAP
jgi:uncharacterized protein YciI